MLIPSQKSMIFMPNQAIYLQLVCLAALFLNSSTSLAAMYKWVDEEGNTHYTQSPPPGDIESESIKPPPKINPEHDQKRVQGRQQMLDDIAKQRKDKNDEALKAEQEAQKRASECEMAKKRLASYERPRIMVKDANGNPTRLDEEQRMAEIKKSRDLVKEACKK